MTQLLEVQNMSWCHLAALNSARENRTKEDQHFKSCVFEQVKLFGFVLKMLNLARKQVDEIKLRSMKTN